MSRVFEKSRQAAKIHWSDPSSTREYAVTESATRDDCVAAMSFAGTDVDTVDGVDRFFESMDIKEFGGGCWDVVVHYSKNPNSVEMTFDLAAGSFKTTESKETIATFDCINGGINTDATPNFNKGVGYNGTHFEGADVQFPTMHITINKKLKFTGLNPDYLDLLKKASQTVNDDDFTFEWKDQDFTFAKGELRYRGSKIKQTSDDDLDINYDFLWSKNITVDDNLRIGDSEPIEKEGHQYLWVYYENSVNGFYKIKKPIAVYIERFYNYSNFDDLQL